MRRGQAIVEFAIIVPFALALILVMTEAGFLVIAKAAQDRATYVVAQWAADHRDESWHAVAEYELKGCDVSLETPLPRPDRGDRDVPVPTRPVRGLEPATNVESGGSRRHARAERQSHAGRFSLLMIDNVTGRAKRVTVQPVTVESLIRTGPRMSLGFLRGALINTALALYPEFETEQRQRVEFPSVEYLIVDESPHSIPWKPRWRRRSEDHSEDGQGLAEYALILALVAVVAIVALAVLGTSIADFLSQIASAV